MSRLRRAIFLVAAALAGTLASCAVTVPPPVPGGSAPMPAHTPAPARPHGTDGVRIAAAEDTVFWNPVLGPPRALPRSPSAQLGNDPRPVDASTFGGVDWTPRPTPVPGTVREVQELDSLAALDRLVVSAPALRAWALRRRAGFRLAAGDTLAAIADLAAVSPRSPWGWEALRVRCDLVLVREGPAVADSLLATVDRSQWTDLERAAWLLRRTRFRATAGDTAEALRFARQLIRRYPSTAPAVSGVVELEGLLARSAAESLTVEDRLAAVEVAALRGDRDAAARGLRDAIALAPAERRSGLSLRRAELLRGARRFEDGLAASASSVRLAATPAQRARALLERARMLRDAGRPGAIAGYDSVTRIATDPALRSAAHWERAWELEGEGRREEARTALESVAALGGERAEEAAMRAGLLALLDGRRDEALAVWERVSVQSTTEGDETEEQSGERAIPGRAVAERPEGERIAFWRAVVRRGRDRAGSDSVLAAIAARPGYDFYRVAARETLGVTGWPGAVVSDTCTGHASCEGLELAASLGALDAPDDAHLVLQRFNAAAVAETLPRMEDSLAASARWLAASRIAYGIGRVPLGIRFGQRALALAAGVESRAWATVPWGFPSPFDSLYRDLHDSLLVAPLDRELLRAVAWQESRFDPQARSRSNAIGLYQMKLPTAGDVARWLREKSPVDSTLTNPARSLRYGAAYMNWLLNRFDRNPVVAIAAYNSGPSAVSPAWREQIARGGEALFCEMIRRYETRDYVRKVLGARQAYREMRPRTMSP